MTAVELAYLGAAGWHFRAGDYSLLIDPYFTRLSLWAMLSARAAPDVRQIRRSTPPADAILVTHPHFDHLMDVPEASRGASAPVYVSPQGADLLEILGVPSRRICPIHPGDRLALGPFEVRVFATPHRLIFGRVPYAGPLRPGLKPPLRASDYRLDFQYSFLVAADGLSVLVASGIRAEPQVEADVLLVGADASPAQLARILDATRPRLVFPNHWDDMFIPLSRPVQPMLIPPQGILPTARRIDLTAFARTVCARRPACEVIVPERFRAYSLADSLNQLIMPDLLADHHLAVGN